MDTAYLTGIYSYRAHERDRDAAGLGPLRAPHGPGPSGDAGEGLALPVLLGTSTSAGRGDSYTPLPGVLPTKDHLDYVQKFSTASLLLLGLVMLIFVGVINPRRAVGIVAAGAQRQAGVR